MNENDKAILREYGPFLLENLQSLPEIMDHLCADRIFNIDRVDEVNTETTRQDKIGCLISILRRRGSKAFGSFVGALHKTGQSHIATVLENPVLPAAPFI